jgi:general secretion pathway protein F
MRTYTYEAMTAAGELIRGAMEASGSMEVIESLRQRGYIPVTAIEKDEGRTHPARSLLCPQRIPLDELSLVTRELSAMLGAGLTLEQGLGLLLDMARHASVRLLLQDVLSKIRSGSSFFEALQAHKEILPKTYAAMVKAGEAGGGKTLESALGRLANQLDKAGALRDTIVSALLYPVVLLITAVLSVLLLLIFVLPGFEPLFQSNPEAMPFSMKVVLIASHFLTNHGLMLALALIAVLLLFRVAMRSEAAARKRDTLLLKSSITGPFVSRIETAKFCRTLAALHGSGISMAAALPFAAESAGNRVFSSSITQVAARIREGKTLSSELFEKAVVPAFAIQIIKIGEETGHLGAMLVNLAEVCERDVQKQVTRMMTLLTPAITIGLGVMIGGIIATVISAILSVNDLVG